MAAKQSLPENYTEIYSIDLQKNKKMSLLINTIAVIIAVAFIVPVHSIIPITSLFDMSNGLGVYAVRFIVLLVAMLVYMILHELVHGITMKIFGTKKIKYGFTGLYAYAGSDDYYDKKSYITIALAPIVVWGFVLTIACFLVSREWFWVVYFIQIINLSGAAGDLFVTVKFSKMPKDILIHDHGVGMTVYSTVKEEKMKNRLYVKLICFVLTALFLTGCAGRYTPTETVSTGGSSETDSASSSTETPTEKPKTNSFGLPIVEESKEFGDLLLQIPGGKTVTLLGELNNLKYNDAKQRLEDILSGYSREVALVAYSLDNRKAVSFNAEAEFFPACTVKAFYSLYNCFEMDKGNGSLDTAMEYKYEHRDPDWGTGDMKFSDYGTVFDLKTIITKSMSISDNVGYNMQVDYFGRDGYNEWVSGFGCPSLQIKPTVWALRAKADEHAVMWREIYRYFISDAQHSEFLYSTCTGTKDNFASMALTDVEYSHKQGYNGGGGWHAMSDAGIIWKDGNPYVIVILTNSINITPEAQTVMDEAINIIHNELF